jgi:hypothetical protein
MRRYGPKTDDHPSVGEPCPVCGVAFRPGDYTTLQQTHAASLEDAKKAQEGRAFTAEAVEVHWDCRTPPSSRGVPA